MASFPGFRADTRESKSIIGWNSQHSTGENPIHPLGRITLEARKDVRVGIQGQADL